MCFSKPCDEHWYRDRIKDASNRKSSNQQAGNGCAWLACCEKKQSHIWKQPVNDNRFKKDRAKTDLGARIGENAAEIRKHCRAMETRRRSALDLSQSEEGRNRHHQTEEAENREHATPAEIVTNHA